MIFLNIQSAMIRTQDSGMDNKKASSLTDSNPMKRLISRNKHRGALAMINKIK
jgi:hypothetical protein